ncbi:MAG: sulfite exporter TauE/SafE family protein [Armatimonadetes bacterium]|nr:sulfite exporter TauE/SafE family protein [Armatimonadota bacterium]
MHLELWQWLSALAAAVIVGMSKTCVPGAGALVISILACGFKGRESIGIMTPMLIIADSFAVYWYRRHTQWNVLAKLVPGVLSGMAVGALCLWGVGILKTDKDILGMVIGIMLLLMLVVYFLQNRLDERLTPKSRVGVAATGITVGFSTMVSNAAGPVMSIYLAARQMPKKEFMGTLAWYFFILNVSKLPIYVILDLINPRKPILTHNSLLLPLILSPGIILGVFAGKWLLHRIPQKLFEEIVVILAGVAAIKLIIG